MGCKVAIVYVRTCTNRYSFCFDVFTHILLAQITGIYMYAWVVCDDQLVQIPQLLCAHGLCFVYTLPMKQLYRVEHSVFGTTRFVSSYIYVYCTMHNVCM